MHRKPRYRFFLTWWSVLGGLLLAVILLGGFWAAFLLFRQPGAKAQAVNPAITIVPAPTLTPVISMPAPVATSTPTADSSQSGVPEPKGAINVGDYVQILGTGGVGLHLRAQPGTTSKALFLGMESEVYQVKDGPQQKDGFAWYYLVAPYDKNRSGWAASNYLSVVQKP